MAEARQRERPAIDHPPHAPRSGPPAADAASVMAAHARTSFNFAARFLPSSERRDATDLYAFFRTLDDLVDDSHASGQEPAVRAELAAWRAWLTGARATPAPREPLGSALARVIAAHGVPVELFLHMLDGLEADLGPREIETEAELQRYCYQVASTVGHAMAHVLGATGPAALAAADRLGAAMQLTNILRDVGEDLDAGRVYLPRETLAAHGLTRADLLAMRHGDGPDARLCALMREQIARARLLYMESLPGIWLLPRDCRYPILVAARLYRSLLDIVEANGCDSLRRRAATTRAQKAREALVCWALVRRRPPRPAAALVTAEPIGSPLEVRGD